MSTEIELSTATKSALDNQSERADVGSNLDQQMPVRCWKYFKDLDGYRWEYTASVLTTGALSLVALFQERGFLEGHSDSNPIFFPSVSEIHPAIKEIFESIFLLLFAALYGLVAFVILRPNLQITSQQGDESTSRQTRQTAFLAFLFLLLANTLTVINSMEAENAYKYKQKDSLLHSWLAHYFLIVMVIGSMLLTNILFFIVVLKKHAITMENKRGQGANDEGYLEKLSQNSEQQTFMWKVAIALENAWDNSSVKFMEISVRMANVVSKNVLSREEPHKKTLKDHIAQCDQKVSNSVTGGLRLARCSFPIKFLVNCQLQTRKFFVDDLDFMWVHIHRLNAQARGQNETSSNKLNAWRGVTDFIAKLLSFINSIRPMIESKGQELWEGVREDDTYTHTAWVKAAVITAVILMLYFGVAATMLFSNVLNDGYLPLRQCLIQNTAYTNFFLRLLGYSDDAMSGITPVEMNIQEFANKLVGRFSGPSDQDRWFLCGPQYREDDPDVRLVTSNLVEEEYMPQTEYRNPGQVFLGSTLGRFVMSCDIVLRKMNLTVWIGFVVGFLIGCYSLLSILGQYKRITLAIHAGYFDRLVVDQDKRLSGPNDTHKRTGNRAFSTSDWDAAVRDCPMSSTMFFFGILVSTAVLQLIVFGGLIAFLIALVASTGELYPLMKQLSALLIAFVASWFLNDVLSQWAIGEGVLQSRYRVLKETWFVLFLFVYTMVHLVLGILFALSRLMLLMISSLVVLNRLDRNLYTYHKSLDQGHRAFVATVLMHVAFHAEIRRASEKDSNDTENGENQIESGDQGNCNNGEDKEGPILIQATSCEPLEVIVENTTPLDEGCDCSKRLLDCDFNSEVNEQNGAGVCDAAENGLGLHAVLNFQIGVNGEGQRLPNWPYKSLSCAEPSDSIQSALSPGIHRRGMSWSDETVFWPQAGSSIAALNKETVRKTK